MLLNYRLVKRNIGLILIIITLVTTFFFPYQLVLAPYTIHKKGPIISKNPIEWGKNYIIFSYKKDEVSLNSYKISFKNKLKIERLSYKINYFENLITEVIVTADIEDGNNTKISLETWYRLLENQDLFVFLRFKNNGAYIKDFEYTLSVITEKLNDFTDLIPYRFTYSKSDDGLVNIENIEESKNINLPRESIYLKVNDGEKTKLTLFKGCIFQFRNVGYGLQERIDDPSNITLSLNMIGSELQILNNTSFKEKNNIEDWYLISEKSLLNINSAVTKKYMRVTDFSLKKRYFENGFYYLTENNTGYRNENKNTYYWDYSMYAPRSLLEFYFTSYETFIYDIAINSFYALYKSRNKYGFWYSTTESNWLKSEYKICNEYFDTRFSVDAAIFLALVYKRLNIKEALDLSSHIGNLLIDYIKEGRGIKTKNNGFLLYDYIIPENKSFKTHFSLNHILNEVYFLILLYDLTDNPSYKDASIKLINGIAYFGNSWINKANGDIYYCGKDTGKFERKDYTTLTYNDLIKVNKITKSVLEEEFEIIKNLRKSKELFLLKEGIIKVKKFTLDKDIKYVRTEKQK